MRQVFTAPDAPTAIFLLADFWAPAVYTELAALGLRVPEDVALVGFDDVVQPGLEGLELTSMAQDFEGIGRSAAEMILLRIEEPDSPIASQVFPAQLRIRRSSSEPLRPFLAHAARPEPELLRS
jgi:LacI family transcriptional regulator